MDDLGPPTKDDQYYLHVPQWGHATEIAEEVPRQSVHVTIVERGDGYVIETTRTYNCPRAEGGKVIWDAIKPPGGWMLDEPSDHWTQWRRRRTWQVE
jgi:hypothetical protein